MLKQLFGSGARVKLITQFVKNPTEEFFIRELTRVLDEQINSLRRELENLESIGLLKSTERNRRKYYKINSHFELLHELTSIVRKTDEFNDKFLKDIKDVGDIDVLILSGQFIQEKSDTDLFLVGDIDKKKLEGFLEENFADKNIKYTTMTREDFLYRISLKDKFVFGVFKNKSNLVLKNKLKKDTQPLVE